jgi:hypothetical protein
LGQVVEYLPSNYKALSSNPRMKGREGKGKEGKGREGLGNSLALSGPTFS